MNILHITSAATWRGGERQIKYLMEGLSKAGHSNFLMAPKVSVLGFRTLDLTESKIVFLKGLFSTIFNIVSLNSYCKKNKIDIVHGHDSHAHTLLWLTYKFGGLKSKSLITRRLLFPIKKRSLGKYNFEKIEYIICISQAVKSVLSKSIINKERLKVIHSGIDLKSKFISKEKKINGTEINVGYVAAFTEEKDHYTFFKTANYLTNAYPDLKFKFILVGDGPLIEKYKNQSTKINSSFEFLGFIEDVEQCYLNIDIVLHTSKSEALGTSILDAQKYGIPVVATDVGGIPEIIIDGKNGYLCEVGDFKSLAEGIYTLSSDKATFESFSKNSLENLSHFDKFEMVMKTIDLYKQLIKQ